MKFGRGKRILVTGAAGPVGKCLVRFLAGSGNEIIAVDKNPHGRSIIADLEDERALNRIVEVRNPDLIIHLAAITNLKFCEDNKQTSNATNYGITEKLVKICAKRRIKMIFFSSDYVFGERDHLWTEVDRPCPNTQYGKDKAASEHIIQQSLESFAIIRTAQLYGFSGDFVELVRETLTDGTPFPAYANLVNCPTWIDDLLIMLKSIIEENHTGVFHCVGPSPLSRSEFAHDISETYNLNSSLIASVNLDFTTDIRPPVVRLDGSATYNLLNLQPGQVRNNLAHIKSCNVY